MKTMKIGIASYADFKARTMAIARGELKPGPDDPRLWFTSIESLARVLSDKNRALLDLVTAREQQEAGYGGERRDEREGDGSDAGRHGGDARDDRRIHGDVEPRAPDAADHRPARPQRRTRVRSRLQ